jgi:hypothetical protein
MPTNLHPQETTATRGNVYRPMPFAHFAFTTDRQGQEEDDDQVGQVVDDKLVVHFQ